MASGSASDCENCARDDSVAARRPRDQVAQSRASITAKVIALYEALGGGWESS